VQVRPISATDLLALAELYLRAYGLGAAALGDAVAEVESTFDGTWGDPWPDASPVAWFGTEPVAAVQTVRRPTMKDAPDCPWLIEVFTDPRHGRAALARTLLVAAGTVIAADGEDHVGLTVDDDNGPALSLYRSLGFTEVR
jgi:GNAT superfamily N-acetyltransferase